MKNKKMLTITLLLITIHLLFLSSCSISSGNSGYSKSKAKKAVKAVEDGGEQRYALPLATASPEDTVTQLYADKFASEVYRLSDGRIKIQVYPNSTLGGDRDLLESCRDGDIPFIVQNTGPQVTFMPDLAVFDLPEIYDSMDDYRAILDKARFRRLLNTTYSKGGYHFLGIADQGFRVMSTNRKVQSIDDFKGQKIRTMENSYHLNFWESIGANPLPMSFAEVYIGLQQHTIDAQENPYEVIVSNKLYEQQKYIVETNHLPHMISLIMNEDFYNTLSAKDQKIMDEASANATIYARKQADKRIQRQINTVKKSGTKVIELDDKTREEIKARSKGVRRKIRKHVDKEIYDEYISAG